MREWVRDHPRHVDAALAAPLFFSTAPFALETGNLIEALSIMGLAFGICFPAVFRRDRPLLAFAIAAGSAFVQWLVGVEFMPADMVAFAALYNVASRCGRNASVLAAGVVEIGAVLAVLRLQPGGAAQLFQLFTSTVLVIAVAVWGSSVKVRRDYLAGLEERAVRAERERDIQAQIAAAEERARIARELHDVVAHGLSVMVVQADGAAYALDTAPERTREALRTVSLTGRNALAEMRRMLGVLREGESDRSYAPQPGIAQLDQLVDRVRLAGLPVEFAIDGAPQELPAGMELAAYRVVQEALTNTFKHAGPTVSGARVELSFGDDGLEMRISDDGRGAAVAGERMGNDGHTRGENDPEGEAPSGQGQGLISMRERVAMYGGSVSAGPRTGGGYEVVASLPLRPQPE